MDSKSAPKYMQYMWAQKMAMGVLLIFPTSLFLRSTA